MPYTHPYTAGMAHQGLNRKGQSMSYSLPVFNSFAEAVDFAKCNPSVTIVSYTAGDGCKTVVYRSDDSLTRLPNQEFSLPVFNSFAVAVNFAKCNPGFIIVRENAGYGWKAVGYQSDDSLMRLSNWECLACEATEDVCGYEDAYEEIYCYEDNGEGVYDYENNDEDVYDYEDPEEGVCDYRDNDEDDGYDYNDQSLIWNDFMSDADDYAHSDRDGWFYSD